MTATVLSRLRIERMKAYPVGRGGRLPQPTQYQITQTGCYECCSHTRIRQGYSWLKFGKKRYLVHRLMYQIQFGTIPMNLVIRHTCDNPKCIRIDHLLIGTQKENIRDSIERGRFPKGENRFKAKISESKVREILQDCNKGLSDRELGKKHGVTVWMVTDIRLRRTWKHVELCPILTQDNLRNLFQ